MDPSQAIGNPLLVAGVTAVTILYVLVFAWMSVTIYRITPELLQVQLFRKLRMMQNSILSMGLGLIGGMVLVSLFMADVALPDWAWAAGAGGAAVLFWYGLYAYYKVFHLPGRAAVRP